jgi:redox-sensitive bicupin YhaK (pirin superfamily)
VKRVWNGAIGMDETRHVAFISRSKPTIEGAGVRLKRAFGYDDVPRFDPFLMLDDFSSGNPEDYLAGFPWHPHRGIETVTYMLGGLVEHGDSMGNKGAIGPGELQWMTAGSGIVHQEMPQRTKGMLAGFQLWVNLPASKKMMDPRYRDVKAQDPPVADMGDGILVKVIAGEAGGKRGPVRDIVVDIQYLDVTMPPKSALEHPVKRGHNAFAYVFQGRGQFGPDPSSRAGPENIVLFGDGESTSIRALDGTLRFLLVCGKPIGEPVAWGGPIVMNTQEELELAFEEYENGTFLKHQRPA